MSYRDILMIADFMNESAAQEAKYNRACLLWESKQKSYDDEDVKVIDPASLGFNVEPKRSKMCNEDISDDLWTEAYKWFESHGYKVHDSDEGGFTFSKEVDGKQFYTADEGWKLYKKLSSNEDGYSLNDEDSEFDDVDEIDASEYGFCELQESDEDDVLHDDNEMCSIVVDVTNEDEFADKQFENTVKGKFNNGVKVEKLTEDGLKVALFKISGQLGKLKEFYAFYLGESSWDNLLGTDAEDEFCNSLQFEDGDSLAEAELRESLASMLSEIDDFTDDESHAHNTDGKEPIEQSLDIAGVKASSANLAGQDEVEMSVVEKLLKRVEELEKKLLLGDTPDEDKAEDEEKQLLKFFEDEDEEDEIQLEEDDLERVTPEEALEDQVDVALTAKEYVDKKAAGEELTQGEEDFIKFAETFCDCKLTEDYLRSATKQQIESKVRLSYKGRSNSGRIDLNLGKEDIKKKIESGLPKRGNKHWDWPEWQKVLDKLTPEQAEELYYELMDDAMESGRAGEAAFIKSLFGKKVHSANRVAGTAVQYSDNERKHGSRSDQSRFETNLLNKLEEVLTVLSLKDGFRLATQLLEKYLRLWQLRKMSEEAFKQMIDAQRAAGQVKPNTKPTRKNLFDAGIKAMFKAMGAGDKQFRARFCEEWLKRTLKRDWPEKWLPKYDELKAKWKAEAAQANESLKNALIGGAIGTGVGAGLGALAKDSVGKAGAKIATSSQGAANLTLNRTFNDLYKAAGQEGNDAAIDAIRDNTDFGDKLRSDVGYTVAKNPITSTAVAGGAVGAGVGAFVKDKDDEETNESLKNALIGGAIGTGVGALAGTLASDKIKHAGEEIANSTPGAKELTDIENERNHLKSVVDIKNNAEGTTNINNMTEPGSVDTSGVENTSTVSYDDIDKNIDSIRNRTLRSGVANDADAVRSAVGRTIAKKPLTTAATTGGVVGAGIGSFIGNKKEKKSSASSSVSSASSRKSSSKRTKA